MEQIVNRIQPNGRPDEYKTYAVASPIETHTRDASCSEVDCEAYAQGWRSTIDVSTRLGAAQAKYIVEQSGRSYTLSEPIPNLLIFEFAAGQECFAQHRVTLDRPSLFIVQGGDWRGNPLNTPRTLHSGPDPWVDDFATHQEKLKAIIERG